MAKGRPRGESDLGRPPLRTRGVSFAYGLPPTPELSNEPQAPTQSRFSLQDVPREILTAILLPLPYLMSSLLCTPEARTTHASHSTKLETAEEILEEVASTALPLPSKTSSLVQACTLTAGTLLLVGLLGRTLLTPTPLDRRKIQSAKEDDPLPRSESKISLSMIRRILLRIIKIGLPFLATVEIGGLRTGTIILSAAAGGLFSQGTLKNGQAAIKPWKLALTRMRFTCVLFVACAICDVVWLRKDADVASLVRGYVALAKSVLFLQLPFVNQSGPPSRFSMVRLSSFGGTASTPTNTWSASVKRPVAKRQHFVSQFISTTEETNITIVAGGILTVLTLGVSFLLMVTPRMSLGTTTFGTISIFSASAAILFANPALLQTRLKFSYALGVGLSAMFGLWFDSCSPTSTAVVVAVAISFYVAVQIDTSKRSQIESLTYATTSTINHERYKDLKVSSFTMFLLYRTETWPLLHGILLEKESRSIVYFMLVNFSFMFIQTFYALLSGSLGLLSDSIHMFFDCVGLLAGLLAAVMSKWPPNSKYPYGYGKVDTLSGLGNGIFLMIISVEIMWESTERFFAGAELRRITELLVVSVGGLIVNLLGLAFIGHHHHGHDHGHDHGHGHSHSHSHTNGHSHDDDPAKHVHDDHHLHDHNNNQHHHDHGNENMAGIYLHILADTMGSVAVIISAILISYTGWSGWDPIASFIIAVLIILAAYPLVTGSARKLLLTVPSEVEYGLRSALQELSGLRGVEGYAVPRFWLNDLEAAVEVGHAHHAHHDHHDHQDHQDHNGHHHENGKEAENCSHHHDHDHEHSEHDHHDHHDHTHTHIHSPIHNHHDHHDQPHSQLAPTPLAISKKILGVIHIIATPSADLEDVRIRVNHFFEERNMDVLVHVERQDSRNKCWCGGVAGTLASPSPFSPGVGAGPYPLEQKLSRIFSI